jgi:hypothetical protein
VATTMPNRSMQKAAVSAVDCNVDVSAEG